METVTNVNNNTMRTKEELLKAVNLSLDDDNKRTPLTTVLIGPQKYFKREFNNNI